MDDLFYFSTEIVTLDDVIACADLLGYTTARFATAGMNYVSVLETSDRYTQWTDLNDGSDEDPTSSFETEQQVVLSAYQPRSMLMASYHTSSGPALVRMLRLLLERFGGWVGKDDGRFERKYSSEDIEGSVEKFTSVS